MAVLSPLSWPSRQALIIASKYKLKTNLFSLSLDHLAMLFHRGFHFYRLVSPHGYTAHSTVKHALPAGQSQVTLPVRAALLHHNICSALGLGTNAQASVTLLRPSVILTTSHQDLTNHLRGRLPSACALHPSPSFRS